MVVLDMAGTTVKDENEVEKCFREAIDKTGLVATSERINSMMGWSKRVVFDTLWREQLAGKPEVEILENINRSYMLFKEILEKHYKTFDVLPTEGCLELFEFLKAKNIKIALTTGFYRRVTDIILDRLGWNAGLDRNYPGNRFINASISSDQVVAGRPAPFMIFRAMELCCVNDVRTIVKIGDTPSDLAEGKNAGCAYSLGITNGTHTREQLDRCENDGLMDNLVRFREFLEERV